MKTRTVTLLDQESASTATQRVIDLDTSDPISQIAIVFRGTNNGSTPLAHPDKMISKIEVVDGSNVLASVSGTEANAAALSDSHGGNYPELTYINDAQAISSIVVNFGRALWDKLLAFDPTKYKNPQLKITHNKALGGCTCDAGTLSVFVKTMSDLSTGPIGFLSLREIKSESLTSSANHTCDLPIDQIIRRVLVQSMAAGKQPHEQYNKIKLSIDQDKILLIPTARVSDLSKFLEGNPLIAESLYGRLSAAANTFYITPGYAANVVPIGIDGAATTLYAAGSTGGSVALTSAASVDVKASVSGKLPHNTLNIPMGDMSAIDDWLDLSGNKKLEMVVTAGSSVGASSTMETVVETLVKY
jgi:hypothetical protein